MKAIPTIYDRIEYRSRLEAKWSAFFDQLGWDFTYEPFDGDYYTPDFIIHGRTDIHRNVPWVSSSLVVEIKPAVDVADYWRAVPKVADGLADFSRYGVVVFGVSPKFFPVGVFRPHGRPGSTLWWPSAEWRRCRECLSVGLTVGPEFPGEVISKILAHHYPCGHIAYSYPKNMVDHQELQQFWATACNNVKWRGTGV